MELEINKLFINPTSYGNSLSKPGMLELVESIKEQGLEVPIVVQEFDEDLKRMCGCFGRVVSGFRRIAAYRLLEKKTILAIVLE